jgi:hypothetical protein
MFMLLNNPAQADSAGPYYATPSWDQTLPAATRFIVLSNMNSDAVLDRETGLVWERAPGLNTATFDGADFFLCNSKNIGGRKGWRVPSLWELLTLVDSTQNPPFPLDIRSTWEAANLASGPIHHSA